MRKRQGRCSNATLAFEFAFSTIGGLFVNRIGGRDQSKATMERRISAQLSFVLKVRRAISANRARRQDVRLGQTSRNGESKAGW